MTAYTGSIDTTLELNDGITDLWALSDEDSAESGFDSGDSSGEHDEYYYTLEFPLTTFEGVYEGSVEMTLGTLTALAPGEYAIGNADGLSKNTLYVRMSDDSNPDDSSADTISIEQKAHYNFLHYLKTVLETANWVTQRYNTETDNHELLIKAPGYSGTDSLYCGFYAYQDSDNDYYNIVVAAMTGYVAGNTFFNQPGIWHSAFCCHNLAIDYWLSVTGGRVNGCLKVGTPVYEHFGVGNFLPFAAPNQYPQPLFVAGTLVCTSTQLPATRFSDTTHKYPWKVELNNIAIHKNDGAWQRLGSSGHVLGMIQIQNAKIRPIDGTYVITPLYFYEAGSDDIFGQLDGIYNITGFDNSVENTMVIDAVNYVVLQNISRTGAGDYIAMELV